MEEEFTKIKYHLQFFKKTKSLKSKSLLLNFINHSSYKNTNSFKRFVSEIEQEFLNQKTEDEINDEEIQSLLPPSDQADQLIDRILFLSQDTLQKSSNIISTLTEDTEILQRMKIKTNDVNTNLIKAEGYTNQIKKNQDIHKLYLISIIILLAIINGCLFYLKFIK